MHYGLSWELLKVAATAGTVSVNSVLPHTVESFALFGICFRFMFLFFLFYFLASFCNCVQAKLSVCATPFGNFLGISLKIRIDFGLFVDLVGWLYWLVGWFIALAGELKNK